MKRVPYILLLTLVLHSCVKWKDDDLSFLQSIKAPSDETMLFKVADDNSGLVTITPNSAGGTAYDIYFGDGTTAPERVAPGKSATHVYKEGTYPVKVVTTGMSGLTSDTTAQLTVTFRAPEAVNVTTNGNAHTLTVSATALYATGGFKVSFGEAAGEEPVLIAGGASITHTYAKGGDYTVTVEALSGGKASTIVTKTVTIYDPLTLPMTFELSTVSYAWGDFGGSQTSVIPNPVPGGINTSATVGKIVKTKAEVWAGNFIILTDPIDFTNNKKFKVKVYSWRAGMRVQLQLERNGDNTFQEHTEATTTVANAWEELTFDFSGIITDNSKQLQNILFFLDNGVTGDGSNNFTCCLMILH